MTAIKHQKINEEYLVTHGNYELYVQVNLKAGTMSMVSPVRKDRNSPHNFVFDKSYPETVDIMSALFKEAARISQIAIDNFLRSQPEVEF